MQKLIIVVDDNFSNLAKAEEVLEKHYRIITLPSAERLFKILEKVAPDLILLDVMMPEMDGFQAMKLLKENELHKKIPVIFLTALNDAVNEASGIELGAVDFISKPFSEPVLLNRIKCHLNIDEIIRERTAQLVRLQNSIVNTMANIVESRDQNTGGHIERTTYYTKVLLEEMLKRKIYMEEIIFWDVEQIVSSARLHDLGKVAISDIILNKPGKLSEEEFKIMKTHALEGTKIIEQMENNADGESFLHNAKLVITYHHERWDGTGYPYGLNGTDIPLLGRIMAVVDVYDALTTERPYKRKFSSEEAYNIITLESGTHFDPKIVDTFVEIKERIEAMV